MIKQYVTLTRLGGNDTKIRDLERVLVDIKAADINDKRLLINQEDEDIEEEKRLRFMKKSVRNETTADDEDDFYD